MKKYVILILITVIFWVIYIPSASSQFFRGYGFIGFGPAKTSSGSIFFYYVDESPSQDNLTSSVDISKQNIGITLGLGFDYVFKSNFFGRIGLSGMLGQVRGSNFDFGIGYNINFSDKFFVRPVVLLAAGSAKIRLGTLVQNDVYIQVNSKQFYSYEVPVSLSRTHSLLIPQFELGIPSGENGKYEILIGIGYQIPININSMKLSFTGEDFNGDSIAASESISAPNVFLYLDNELIKRNLIDTNGLFAQFTLMMNFR